MGMGIFGLDQASFSGSTILANEPLKIDPSYSLFGNSFQNDAGASQTTPTMDAALPPSAILDNADIAISPAPSLTLSLSQRSFTSTGSSQGVSSQATTALKSSSRQPPIRPRKQVMRTPKDRTSPVKTESRTREDRILIACRENGMSYKKIKVVHGFNVSESTLRGRYRSLTKESSQRPRKPRWTTRDVELLLEAVPLCTRKTTRKKVSWKGVSQYICDHGGTHAFAFTTCRRKWCEVTGQTI
ncbi:hypothetical protein E4U55_001574 [Claviceps digitariae]|nr:hypothetical protein E4U55_001574 [Claviceps digitariae]